MSVATFSIGPLGTNSYVIYEKQEACVIDVGGDPAPINKFLQDNSLKLTAICITHRHFDHLYGVADLASATGAPVFVPEKDEVLAAHEASTGGIWGMPPVPPFKANLLSAGTHKFAGMECQVLETPGHTPGGVSYYFPAQNCVFTGDALFYRSLGRTDFPMGNHAQLLESIQSVLFKLPPATIVYPGHGPATSIGDEALHNPFCGQMVR